MIGIVITGHNHFASGLKSALDLVVGQQENLIAVDFEKGDSTEILQEKLRSAILEVNSGDGVMCLTDLAGGSPFNNSSLLAHELGNVQVIGGTNIPMLISLVFEREKTLTDFAQSAVAHGLDGVKLFELKSKAKDISDEDGI
ncbi:PTS galactosamine/N-acetylgalactosamine transporter subunit IIA [Brevibacillus daliensis]|uniref:PTS galactosamine/N-acetylgalactosamine transporter subunit IIA n=1 Tax=Brevibacillus daliensis TaxID=2892995 RepID=UPI001E443D87|nr:PTS galactosamine/N-acetylgalactosamine transporter subunit IIA [Brevibacillus daliensis]